MGCVLYHLCTQGPPFYGENLISLGYNIVNKQPKPIPSTYSSTLSSFILSLLNKQPASRPSSNEVVTMLGKIIKPGSSTDMLDSSAHQMRGGDASLLIEELKSNVSKIEKKRINTNKIMLARSNGFGSNQADRLQEAFERKLSKNRIGISSNRDQEQTSTGKNAPLPTIGIEKNDDLNKEEQQDCKNSDQPKLHHPVAEMNLNPKLDKTPVKQNFISSSKKPEVIEMKTIEEVSKETILARERILESNTREDTLHQNIVSHKAIKAFPIASYSNFDSKIKLMEKKLKKQRKLNMSVEPMKKQRPQTAFAGGSKRIQPIFEPPPMQHISPLKIRFAVEKIAPINTMIKETEREEEKLKETSKYSNFTISHPFLNTTSATSTYKQKNGYLENAHKESFASILSSSNTNSKIPPISSEKHRRPYTAIGGSRPGGRKGYRIMTAQPGKIQVEDSNEDYMTSQLACRKFTIDDLL